MVVFLMVSSGTAGQAVYHQFTGGGGVLNCLEGPAAAVLGVSRILTWFYETKLKQIQLSFQPARTFPKFHELERSPVVLKYLSFEKQGEHSVKA